MRVKLRFSPQLFRYSTIILYGYRNIGDVLLCLGHGVNAGVSQLLKEIISQPRPESACINAGKCHEHGMPSSHSSFMAFCTVTALLWFSRERRAHLRMGKEFHDQFSRRLITSLYTRVELVLLCFCALLVSYSRIHLGYHTVAQVVCGIGVGALCAYMWNKMTLFLHNQGVLNEICKYSWEYLGFPLCSRSGSLVKDAVKDQ